MPAYLVISGTDKNYRLPGGVDPDEVRRGLRNAMENGRVIDVDYQMGNDPLHLSTLTINGSAVGFVTVVETQDLDQGPVLDAVVEE